MSRVVVAAADSSVGWACVRAFANAGSLVSALVAADGDAGPDRDLLAGLAHNPDGEVEVHEVESLTELDGLAALAAELGPVRTLVNAHFALHAGDLRGTSMDAWTTTLMTNVLGPVASTKAFVPNLAREPPSSIVHLGSIDGSLGNPQAAAYSTSKGALVPLTHVSASELAPLGIRVNCIARAAVHGATLSSVQDGAIAGATPLGRRAAPDEVAAVVVFLASSAASYVTGAVVPVDGGRAGITPGTRPDAPMDA